MDEQRQGRIRAAAFVYEQILQSNPEDSDAWHLLGLVHHLYDTNDKERAFNAVRNFIDRAISIRPELSYYQENAVKILRSHSELYPEACKYLRLALNNLEENERKLRANYLSQLLYLLNEQGEFDEVLESFNRWNRLPRGAKPPPSSSEAVTFATQTIRTLGHAITEALHDGTPISEIEDKSFSLGRTASMSDDEVEVWNQVGMALTYVARNQSDRAFENNSFSSPLYKSYPFTSARFTGTVNDFMNPLRFTLL